MSRFSLPLVACLTLAAPALAADVEVELDTGSGFVIQNDGASVERLRVDEATGNVSRNGALFVHTTGADSTFVGASAGNTSITGDDNTGFGSGALEANTSGYRNAAFGSTALSSNTTGYENAAFGERALSSLTSGTSNVAVGQLALLSNVSGDSNTAVGRAALSQNTAGNNIAIGVSAGSNQTTGPNNIYIGNLGVGGETGRIKIGNLIHTETFIEGIDGNTAAGGVAVLINSSNELHTLVSSARFKQDVRDMGGASERLMVLRPVVFRYREEVAQGETAPEYGLIAEEVAEVAPELVTYDDEGRPYSVRYHLLTPMLLNELQKERRARQEQRQLIATLAARLTALEHAASPIR